MRQYCKRCHAFGNDQGKIEEVVANYIASIEEERKVDEALYQKRLETCDTCTDMMNGMCRFCGCFCVVRAIKKGQTCPHPKGNRWV